METPTAGDFLKTAARTYLIGQYLAAGRQLRITTNFGPILDAAREAFEPVRTGQEITSELRFRFWVDDVQQSGAGNSKPLFRALDHLAFAGFDECNSLLINLRELRGMGRFTLDVASDANFWKTIAFPVLLTILGPSVGLAPLHCACVAWKGSGLLLAGESGAGKSTLSLALAQLGFDFLSDDRTLIGEYQGRLLAWGLSPEMKQGAQSIIHFPTLSQVKPKEIPGQPVTFRFDPVNVPGVKSVRCCEPRWVVFLDRQSKPAFSLTKTAPDEAAGCLESQLHLDMPEVQEQLRRTLESLVARDCYHLQYGGDPHTIAGVLRSMVADGWKIEKSSARSARRKQWQHLVAPQDPLRRFRSTPLVCDLTLMGKSIRLETNYSAVLNHAESVLNCRTHDGSAAAQFRWKIVAEASERVKVIWPRMTAFSDDATRYINLGQRGFIAVDLKARHAVGVIPDHFADDEAGFISIFLAAMFYLSAPALGLVAISAACVALEGRGLLLFGVPGSGKTTACYRSVKLRLEFHADQATFLEAPDGALRAWGDFWPAAFRADAVEIFPEIIDRSQPLVYRDRTFLCVKKQPFGSATSHTVVPVGCIFLDRQGRTSPKLVPIPTEEVKKRLAAFVPFVEDAGFATQRGCVFKALSRLPGYSLAYGSDSSEAAIFLRSILSTHHPMEGAK
jgi:hypothetical protein